jgi:hypothetical protein
MKNPSATTTFATKQEVRIRAKYISASLGIPVAEVIERAVKQMQEMHNLPDPPALQPSKDDA